MKKKTDLKHKPIENELSEFMNDLASLLDKALNGDKKGKDRKFGYMITIFPFGDNPEHRFNYISNAERSTMLSAMKEVIARFEGRYSEPDQQTLS